jgi:hypothetical protein
VIQLSDQLDSETRMEAMTFLHEFETEANHIRRDLRRGDLVAVDNRAKRQLHLVGVALAEADRLTARYNERDDAA